MTNRSPDENEALERSLEGALAGDAAAVRAFLEAFLDGPLWVPNREQSMPLAGTAAAAPAAPDCLAVDDGERLIVPVFSRPAGISEWCGLGLRCRSLSGEQLAAMLPEEWWVAVNPGEEIEKELSPWELAELRSGRAALDGIVQEILSGGGMTPYELEGLAPEDGAPLKQALSAALAPRSDVRAAYLARERGVTAEGDTAAVLVLGVDGGFEEHAARRALAAELEELAARMQIGDEPVRVVVRGEYGSELLFKVLEKFAPFYETAPRTGVRRRLAAWLLRDR